MALRLDWLRNFSVERASVGVNARVSSIPYQ